MSAAVTTDEAAAAHAFVRETERAVAPLLREAGLCSWDAATGGGDAAMERAARARTELALFLSDREAAARVRRWREAGGGDAPLRRELVLLDHEYTRNQLPRETIEDLVSRASELEHVFHTFRASLGGERLSNNELLDALRGSRDSEARRAAWEASKEIGREVAEPLR